MVARYKGNREAAKALRITAEVGRRQIDTFEKARERHRIKAEEIEDDAASIEAQGDHFKAAQRRSEAKTFWRLCEAYTVEIKKTDAIVAGAEAQANALESKDQGETAF